MGNLKTGARPAASVGDLLQWLGEHRALPADFQANAAYWATAMAGRMDQRDVQTVVWLLLEASGDRRVPLRRRPALVRTGRGPTATTVACPWLCRSEVGRPALPGVGDR
jgi:hypothetical protein